MDEKSGIFLAILLLFVLGLYFSLDIAKDSQFKLVSNIAQVLTSTQNNQLSPATNTNYVSGYSSVDDGEIRWGGSTTYLTEWNAAIATWNGLNKINIAPDTIWTYEDLTVSDVNIPESGWVGQYSPGNNTIKLNTSYLFDDTSAQKQNATTHELGHALGLAHNIFDNILYLQQTSQTSLGTQDIEDYHYLWGY